MRGKMPFKSVAEMASRMGLQSGCGKAVRQICTDSRLVKEGDVFFALPGERVDGHIFLQDVSGRGAAAAVVHTSYNGPDYGLPLIKSLNVLDSLQLLAKTVVDDRKPRIVAITGSIGKTTTKDFITTLLRQKYRTACNPGTSNSQVGLPLTILNHTSKEDEIVVLEMGMTHPGNIAKLLEIAPPEVALITTVELVHAVNFDSLEEIALAKSEIFDHPSTHVGILPLEASNFNAIYNKGKCPKLTFSTLDPRADYYLKADNDDISIVFKSEAHELGKLNVPGTHYRMNFLAASAVARSFDISWEQIRNAMPLLALPALRMQFVNKNGILFVNDSYNAAEVSLKAALKSLPAPKAGCKKIGVIGEMLELGKFAEECHRAVGEFALEYVDRLLCLGKGCQPIYEIWKRESRPVELYFKRQELIGALRQAVKPGDVVLLKGSRGNELWKVLEEF